MGMFKLKLDITPKGFEKVAEMAARVKDFSVPFSNIIGEWAEDNARRKFAKGEGAESTGVDQAPARWEPLTANINAFSHEGKRAYFSGLNVLTPYQRRKRKQGFEDWLMVASGSLRDALSNSEGGFAKFIDAMRVVFGTPLDPENEAKVRGNRKLRPTVFLDRTDRGMVRRELQRYLNLGENYKDLMFQAAASKMMLKKQIKEMNMEFSERMSS